MSPAIPEHPSGLPSSRIERLAAGFGLAVFSTVLLLALLEGAVRLYDRALKGAPIAQADPLETLYLSHPYLPSILRPSTDYRDADTAGHINSLGLRGPERPAEKAEGSVRILCVGGSTTFGAGIVGDEKTWPARLEARLLEMRPDLRIEVWNAGVPGHTTAENVIYLSLRLIDFAPDLVILYEGYNDFKPNRHPGFRSDYSHWRDRAVAPRRALLERLRLYTHLRSFIDRLRADPEAPVRDPRTGEKLERFDSVSEEGVLTFERNLRTLIAVARSAGGSPVLATQECVRVMARVALRAPRGRVRGSATKSMRDIVEER
ncbi:MAG TPA: GDSL-type esterase/lipase family protein [Candidatus Polarisedimenticolia bacterium]